MFAEVYERQGSSYLAERHRTAARELWERTAATLPKHLRETFWSHPARTGRYFLGRASDRPWISPAPSGTWMLDPLKSSPMGS